MSARIHIHLHTKDIEKSKDFYEKFFGIKPVKDYEDYAKFLPEFAPVNLAISLGSDQEMSESVSHVGVQLDTSEEVFAQMERVKGMGLQVRDEISVNCCNANQDKFWVRDPNGVDWEVYHLNYDLAPSEERMQRRAQRGKLIGLMDTASAGAGASACCPTPRARKSEPKEETAKA